PLNATGQVAPPGGGSQHCSQAEQHILHDRALQTGAGQREEPRQPTDVSRTPGGEHAVVRHGEPARLRICGNLRRSDCRPNALQMSASCRTAAKSTCTIPSSARASRRWNHDLFKSESSGVHVWSEGPLKICREEKGDGGEIDG
ncbi:LexA repressor, partial [Dissostichus eleginoides]